VKLILFDVDGVLTDGTIWVVPTGGHAAQPEANSPGNDGGFGIASLTMAEAKGFSAHDGMGISLAKVAGIQVGFVTKRVSEAVKARARDLKIDYLYTGQQHKMQAIREIMEQSGLSLAEIAYAGDDIIDLPVLRQCGLAIAVCNARPEVLAAVQYTTACEGGKGAARDAIDFILKAKGILEKTIEHYIDEKIPPLANDIGVGNM
jgi:3-deoxy-D-manno-octulosonate 8-phosphate phosphatase (KDO 8-P phosphatase)